MPVVVIGSAGHAGVIIDALKACELEVAGIVDPAQPVGRKMHDVSVLGGDALLSDRAFLSSFSFALGLGSQTVRHKLAHQIINGGGRLKTIVHPRAFVASNVTIGEGTFLAAGVIVATGAWLGRYCLLNTACSVDHDDVLEDGVQVCPGARLAGHIHCGEDVFIGTNATVLPRVSIGARSVVGAGTVVLDDVPADVTVIGNPGRTKTSSI